MVEVTTASAAELEEGVGLVGAMADWKLATAESTAAADEKSGFWDAWSGMPM